MCAEPRDRVGGALMFSRLISRQFRSAQSADSADSVHADQNTAARSEAKWKKLLPLNKTRFRHVSSIIQRCVAGIVLFAVEGRVTDWDSSSFLKMFKNLKKGSHREIHSETSKDIYPCSTARSCVDTDVQHLTKDVENREERLIQGSFETDERLQPKEFKRADDDCFEQLETDDHFRPKEFDLPEAWELRDPDEAPEFDDEDDYDLHPPYEPDDYDPDLVRHDEAPDDRDDLCDFESSSKTFRQPATDIKFKHLRIGGYYEITTPWKPNMCGAEKARLSAMLRTDDLKPFMKLARAHMGRFRKSSIGIGKYSLNDQLPGDKLSAGGRKLQLAVRSMVAGASVTGIPDEAVSFVTIDFAATPELPIWLKAGGAVPEDLFADGIKRIEAALHEVGAVHVLREGFSEVAQAVNAADENERCAGYAKAYAKQCWPESLSWDDHADQIFVPHIHGVFVLLDKDGHPISAERLGEALRKQFPLPRAVRVEPPRDSRWAPGGTLPEKVAAFIRYHITKKRELTEAEITENIRWSIGLQSEHIFFSGWTSFVETSAMAVPIMRRSLLSRHKLQEALVDFDIGPGRCLKVADEIAVEPVHALAAGEVVVRLDDYRRRSGVTVLRADSNRDSEDTVNVGLKPSREERGSFGVNVFELSGHSDPHRANPPLLQRRTEKFKKWRIRAGPTSRAA